MNPVRLPWVNRILITGRLTRDPEVRYTPSGHAVTTLGLAANRPYKDPSGIWQEETCFVSVVVWDRLAEQAGEHLKKGSAIFVEGRLTSRSWETPEGQKRQAIEIRAERIQFLDRTGDGESKEGGEGPGPDESAGRADLPF